MQLEIQMNLQIEVRLSREVVKLNIVPACRAIRIKSFCAVQRSTNISSAAFFYHARVYRITDIVLFIFLYEIEGIYHL
jgi:hypothetical protein